MRLIDVGFIAAGTERSKAYLQGLIQHDLLPNHALLLKEKDGASLPGTVRSQYQENTESKRPIRFGKLQFDPGIALESSLQEAGIGYTTLPSTDINDTHVIESIRSRAESVFIYSGYGGQILRRPVLNIGKKYLHAHGGYLPDFKGSTTNYYSLLVEDQCGASTLFLTEHIDSGPILRRRKFPPPPDRRLLDYIYDSLYRAEVLVQTLKAYTVSGGWQFELSNNTGGETYFIMHPVLRHVAILSQASAAAG